MPLRSRISCYLPLLNHTYFQVKLIDRVISIPKGFAPNRALLRSLLLRFDCVYCRKRLLGQIVYVAIVELFTVIRRLWSTVTPFVRFAMTIGRLAFSPVIRVGAGWFAEDLHVLVTAFDGRFDVVVCVGVHVWGSWWCFVGITNIKKIYFCWMKVYKCTFSEMWTMTKWWKFASYPCRIKFVTYWRRVRLIWTSFRE